MTEARARCCGQGTGAIMKDILFLLKPGFTDPAYPGDVFYCWHCALLEGILASFPDLAQKLDVRRIAWPRPRAEVVELTGPENQSLPVLVLTSEPVGPSGAPQFINDKDEILKALSARYGFPLPHP